MTNSKVLPLHFYLGLALIAVFWFASWTHLGVLGEYSFFPLWLGYVLTVDGLVGWRKGSSLLLRSPRDFVLLFVLSAPIWWIFEGLNNFVLNWHYVIPADYSVGQVIVESTICFSTVIPAVFETAALVSTYHFVNRLRTSKRFQLSERFLWTLMFAGAFGFAALVLAPRYAFPLTWIWLVLILDPLNHLRGRVSLIEQAANGDYRMIGALTFGVLVCGFFWEMWNFFAFPKWYYTVPFFDWLRIFQMPLLGFLGYIPFAWELYALYHFAWGIAHRPTDALIDIEP
ncbi:MAG: hypothetical protein HZB51_09435 [Chloroflexi bacterium]|nr:hypothetical protein [Chloroflexota bacterium]